jgi:single-strand DNA-binding protein
LVEGRLKLDQWTSPEGDKRSKHEVIVDNFQFLGGRGDGGAPRSSEAVAAATSTASYEPPQRDEIPF